MITTNICREFAADKWLVVNLFLLFLFRQCRRLWLLMLEASRRLTTRWCHCWFIAGVRHLRQLLRRCKFLHNAADRMQRRPKA